MSYRGLSASVLAAVLGLGLWLGAGVALAGPAPSGSSPNGPEEAPRAWKSGEKTYYEIRSGQHWKVLSSMDTARSVKASVDDAAADTFVFFHPSAVDQLEKEGILPFEEAEEVRRDSRLAKSGESGADAILYGIHLEALHDPRPSKGSCFGWQDPEFFSGSWMESGAPGFADAISVGIITGDVDLQVPYQADISADITYQVKEKLCFPYKIRLLEARIHGFLHLEGHLTAGLGFEYEEFWSWKHELPRLLLVRIPITGGVIPLYIDVYLAVSTGIDASIRVAGRAEYQAMAEGDLTFDIRCTGEECSDPDPRIESVFDFSDQTTYELTLDARARLWARAAVELDFVHEDLAHAWAGATGSVSARVYGYLGNTCGDADGDGSNEHVEDLLVDVEAAFELDAGLSGYLLPDRQWLLFSETRNLAFWDVHDTADGWNLTDPIVRGPSEVDLGEALAYTITTRPCYPFDEPISVQWSGATEGAGELIPRTGSLAAMGIADFGETSQTVTFGEDAVGRDLANTVTLPLTVDTPFGEIGVLGNGVAEGPLAGMALDSAYFVFQVPDWAADVGFELSGGSGNADLYVKRDSPPTLGTYDCRSASLDNTESCTAFAAPFEGAYYAMVHGATAFAGAELVATFTEPSGDPLTVDVPITGLAGSAGGLDYFTLEVPAGAQDLSFTLDGGTGDADLYVRHGAWPTLGAFDCKSAGSGNDDQCFFADPMGGTYHGMLHGFTDYAGATLLATYQAPVGGGPLDNGVPVVDLGGPAGSEGLFVITLPEGVADLEVTLSGGSGDADLYLRHGAPPDRFTYDCPSRQPSSTESCVVDRPEPGPWYVLVYGFSDFSSVTLEARWSEALALANGLPVTVSGVDASETFFVFDVPDDATTLSFTLSGGSGDADLYVHYEEPVTLHEYTCRSAEPDNEELCEPPLVAGRYHVLVFGFDDYADVALEARYSHLADGTPLVRGELEDGLLGGVGSEAFFVLDVPEGATELDVQLLGGTGDADLYLRYGHRPTTSEYDCRSWNEGNAESCLVAEPSVGPYHVMVHGYSDYSDTALLATYRLPTSVGGPLNNGDVVPDLAANEDEGVVFQLTVPDGAAELSICTTGGEGEADLYVRLGQEPTTTDYNCADAALGNEQECRFTAPEPGVYHIRVHGFDDYTGVELSVEYQLGPPLFGDGFESGGLEAWSGFLDGL